MKYAAPSHPKRHPSLKMPAHKYTKNNNFTKKDDDVAPSPLTNYDVSEEIYPPMSLYMGNILLCSNAYERKWDTSGMMT